MIPPIAQTVVWRHPCNCPTASRPLAAGEEPEHRFDVDGEPFPYYVTTDGAAFRKSGSLYLVSTTLFPIAPGNRERLSIVLDFDGLPSFEYVDGTRKPFPWALSHEPVTVRAEPSSCPLVSLTFLAYNVDTDGDIAEFDLDQEVAP